MENLGCVTFREAVPSSTRLVRRDWSSKRVADVISHEIAHMWFGDLVTMKWWNGIWLNEAFATYMELACVDHFRPHWERWVSFGAEREAAMATDALHSTRPVEYPVGPPEEAQGMFDVLTYQKGAGVLRMLEQYLGVERFRDGVRRYLNEHQLSNTETSDLWDAIEAASGEPVRDIMDSWIFQGGFPLVSLEEAPGASAGATERWLVTQQPFAYASEFRQQLHRFGLVRPGDGAQGRSRAENEARLLLGTDPVELGPENFRVEGSAAGGSSTGAPAGVDTRPLLLNARGSGYYRVRYPVTHLERLANVMSSLDPLERFNLIGDTWAAVVGDRSSLEGFLVLVEALGEDTDPEVWAEVTSVMSFLDHLVDDRTRPQLAAYTKALIGPLLQRLGWEATHDEDVRTAGLRSQVVGTLGVVGNDPEVRARCAELHMSHFSGDAPDRPGPRLCDRLGRGSLGR